MKFYILVARYDANTSQLKNQKNLANIYFIVTCLGSIYSTINPEIVSRILFSRITLNDIFVTLKLATKVLPH